MYTAVTHVAWLTSLSKKSTKEAAYRLWEIDLNHWRNQPTGPICSPLQCIFLFSFSFFIPIMPFHPDLCPMCCGLTLFVHDLLKLKYVYWPMQTFQYVFSLSFYWYCLLKWVGQKENIFTITLRMGLVEKSVFRSQLLVHPTPCACLMSSLSALVFLFLHLTLLSRSTYNCGTTIKLFWCKNMCGLDSEMTNLY